MSGIKIKIKDTSKVKPTIIAEEEIIEPAEQEIFVEELQEEIIEEIYAPNELEEPVVEPIETTAVEEPVPEQIIEESVVGSNENLSEPKGTPVDIKNKLGGMFNQAKGKLDDINKNRAERSTKPVKQTADGIDQPDMTIGKWLITLIVLSIPIVNIVMFIIWMVSEKTPKSKKNLLIAYLAYLAIFIAVMFIGGAALLGSMFAMFGGMR